MYLFIDTETTGFPQKFGPLIQDGQGRVCQIAMLLTDGAGKSIAEISTLVKPAGWVVGNEASKVHGFTTELCEKYGINFVGMVGLFLSLAEKAETIIAHNISFDRQMMFIEAEYAQKNIPNKLWHCTMEQSAPICNLPPTERMLAAGFDKPKAPKLEEALQHICGKSLGDTAHDALWDVRACKDIFFKLKEGIQP